VIVAVDVGAPVIVAVHLNGNATLIVIGARRRGTTRSGEGAILLCDQKPGGCDPATTRRCKQEHRWHF